MKTSESITKLAPALVAALAEIEGAAKSSENSHFKSKYADLSAVIEASRGVLAKHDLALVQFPGALGEGSLSLETVILHASGEWLSGLSEIYVNKPTPQETGSAITYLRRYAQKAVLNMPDVDDDAEGAMRRNAKLTERKPLSVEPEGDVFWRWTGQQAMNANQAKKAGLDVVFKEFVNRIGELSDGVEIDEWIDAVEAEVQQFPRAWSIELRNKVEERAHELGLNGDGQ